MKIMIEASKAFKNRMLILDGKPLSALLAYHSDSSEKIPKTEKVTLLLIDYADEWHHKRYLELNQKLREAEETIANQALQLKYLKSCKSVLPDSAEESEDESSSPLARYQRKKAPK